MGQERHRQCSGGGHDPLCCDATSDRGEIPRLDGKACPSWLGQRLFQEVKRCPRRAASFPGRPPVSSKFVFTIIRIRRNYGCLHVGTRQQQPNPQPHKQQHPSWSGFAERESRCSRPRTLECLDFISLLVVSFFDLSECRSSSYRKHGNGVMGKKWSAVTEQTPLTATEHELDKWTLHTRGLVHLLARNHCEI